MVTETPTRPVALAAFDDYLRYGSDDERSKGPVTRKAYRWTVNRFRSFLNGRQPTTDLARGFVKELEEKGNSASSINRHIWALKSYFRFLKSGEDSVQVLKIRGLKTNKYYPRYLRDKEWDKLLQTANG